MKSEQNKYQAQVVYDVIQEFLEANKQDKINHHFQTVNKFLLQRINNDKKCLEAIAIDNKIIDKLHIMNQQETINQINVQDEKIL